MSKNGSQCITEKKSYWTMYIHKYCEQSNCRGGWYMSGGLAIYKNQLTLWTILCFVVIYLKLAHFELILFFLINQLKNQS